MLKLVLLLASLVGAYAGPLYDYIHNGDTSYSWYDTGIRLLDQENWKGYVLNMTSQTWLNPQDTDRHVWTHQLVVIVPDKYTTKFNKTAAVYITGGNNNRENATPSNVNADILVCAAIAVSSGTACGVVFQVPNQPIVFSDDPIQKRRSEDAAVAFTWHKYMTDPDARAESVLYFPMAKSAVRAMDAVAEFMLTLKQNVRITEFVIAGASKRGATTWLTGAIDKRVVGIVPIVFDLLNFKEVVQGMFQAFGGWTFAFVDYMDMEIPKFFGTPELDVLTEVIDALNYKQNLTMPKLVIDACGDEFFQPQDDSFWWDLMPGRNHRLMADNAEHSLITGIFQVITSIQAWYQAILHKTDPPHFTWDIDPTDGAITIIAYDRKPDAVVLRYATTVDGDVRRDFRLVAGDTEANPCKYIKVDLFGKACIKPVIWMGMKVAPSSFNETLIPNLLSEPESEEFAVKGPQGVHNVDADGTHTWTYRLVLPPPPVGWRGFLGELYYEGIPGTDTTYRFTTQVSVVPDTYPYGKCMGQECQDAPLV